MKKLTLQELNALLNQAGASYMPKETTKPAKPSLNQVFFLKDEKKKEKDKNKTKK